MGILADHQINREVPITPIDLGGKKPGKISSGLTSYGYDARVGYKFKVFKPYPCTVIDPKAFDPRMMEDVDLSFPGSYPQHEYDEGRCRWCGRSTAIMDFTGHCPGARFILIPPHSFALAETVEEFKIPKDVLAVVVGKSTYARCGLIVNVTPLEPEWEGKVTVELSNTADLPIKVYCGEGIMQVLFFRADGRFYGMGEWVQPGCVKSYADKIGRYQGQSGLTTPTVD